MTNTRLTDVEILESRYPQLMIESFSVNNNNTDDEEEDDEFRGGRGVTRIYRFRQDLTFSILSERRVFQPQGCRGGRPGTRGRNTWLRGKGSGGARVSVSLGSKATIQGRAGDLVEIVTPGGAGYKTKR